VANIDDLGTHSTQRKQVAYKDDLGLTQPKGNGDPTHPIWMKTHSHNTRFNQSAWFNFKADNDIKFPGLQQW